MVSEAGFGRFVYLKGASGKRYIFSSVRSDQAALYDKAIFAEVDNGHISLRHNASPADGKGGTLYVHLLNGKSDSAADILADLNF